MRFIDAQEVRRRLTYEVCIPTIRAAMVALSGGVSRQLPRGIVPLAAGRLFGVMSGAMAETGPFGAKLISVYPDNFEKGDPSHQGLIVLFDPASGAAVCVVDAGAVTAIRTAAASAVATDALARPDASRLALLGYGEQATTHVRALLKVRRISTIRVWGRSPGRAEAFAARARAEFGLPVEVFATVAEAVSLADIICTLTPATEPILSGDWVAPGAHINLVGSGHAGQAEAEVDLVARARFFADSRKEVFAQGGEFLRALKCGRVDESHIVGEIGEVAAGTIPGRRSADEITIYKSLGHIVQDLASAWALYSGETSPADPALRSVD